MSHGRLHRCVWRNRVYRPPPGAAACSKWRDRARCRARSTPSQVTTKSDQAVEYIQADLLDDVTVGAAIAGTDAVVNLAGILTETANQTCRAIHVEGARRVALAASVIV